jgi:hypothetical protein
VPKVKAQSVQSVLATSNELAQPRLLLDVVNVVVVSEGRDVVSDDELLEEGHVKHELHAAHRHAHAVA